MSKTMTTQELTGADELQRLLQGEQTSETEPSAKLAGLRKRPEDDELSGAPKVAAPVEDGGTRPKDAAAAEGEAQPETAAASDAAVATNAEASDPYAFLESDESTSWWLDETYNPAAGENTLLAQASPGGGAWGGTAGEQTLLAQAAQDAGAAAAAGGEAAAGIPAGVAVGGGLLLLAAAGGGGGGGGGETAPVVPVVTAPGTFAAINAALGATIPLTSTVSSGTGTLSVFIGATAGIGANVGFDRAQAPETLAALQPIGVYDLRLTNGTATVSSSTIDYKGLELTLAGGNANIYANATASGAAESNLIWMGNLGIVQSTGTGDGYIQAWASANNGGDAEIGISNFYVNLAGSGTVTAAASVYASASASSTARALIGNDLIVSSLADSANANLFIYAHASSNSTGEVLIGGNVSVSASALTGSARALGVVNADGKGEIAITGSYNVVANATSTASAYLQVFAQNSSTISMNGINFTQNGSAGPGGFLDIYASNSANLSVGDVSVTLGAGSTATVGVQQLIPAGFLLTKGVSGTFQTHNFASTAEVSMGNLAVNVGSGGTANFFMGGVAWDAARTATLSGAGDVYMELSDQIFGTIDDSGLGGALTLELRPGFTVDATSYADADYTTIKDFTAADRIVFDDNPATTGNYTALSGTFSSTASLGTALSAAFATFSYVFAVYNNAGTDINNDGQPDTNLGVLAYDGNAGGIDAVLLLPGVTTLTPADLA